MNTPHNRRRRESQKKMEQAFVVLLETKDARSITVTEIVRLAGVNRTTFYANYEDIPALSEAIKVHLEEEVLSLYQEEWNQRTADHNFLPLFRHIRDNQPFYRAYFKLCPDGKLHVMGYDREEAAHRFGNRHIEYHIEFFGHGLNGIIKKWLEGGCVESPEEMFDILRAEYSGQGYSALARYSDFT